MLEALRLNTFLRLSGNSIGRIGGGRGQPTGRIDVALVQSLSRKGNVDERVADYGHLVVDECHHLPASSFERIARQAKARFVTGLSATVARKDGHQPIIFMQCGPVRHHVDAKQQAAQRPFTHMVRVCPTEFRSTLAEQEDRRVQFQQYCTELITDDDRNRQIRDDVIRASEQGRASLVLTERNEHLDRLADLLTHRTRHLFVLRGGMSKQAMRRKYDGLAAVPDDEPRVLLATGKYIGEGFDDPRLDTLFLTLPVSWRGTIAQYARRFDLNAELPIPFDGAGRMEVDLLCRESRLAIELDGPQHLDSHKAYRRDRRKDMLLQEHGYLVLRFLAEDVGKRLDMVLDTILRGLAATTKKSQPNR